MATDDDLAAVLEAVDGADGDFTAAMVRNPDGTEGEIMPWSHVGPQDRRRHGGSVIRRDVHLPRFHRDIQGFSLHALANADVNLELRAASWSAWSPAPSSS